jgi:uncharacterized membrane protein YqhA
MTMIAPDARHPLIERIVEKAIFASRWFLASIYIGLAAGLLVLLVKFVQRTIALLTHLLNIAGAPDQGIACGRRDCLEMVGNPA